MGINYARECDRRQRSWAPLTQMNAIAQTHVRLDGAKGAAPRREFVLEDVNYAVTGYRYRVL